MMKYKNETFLLYTNIKKHMLKKLSCSLVNNMIHDSYGFIWIGTENGLNKFDGLTFTQYLQNVKRSQFNKE